VADRTECLQLVSELALVRTGDRDIDGYDAVTGIPRWTVSRDGAVAVQVLGIPDTPNVVVLRLFDRPPPASGLIEGSSYSLHMLDTGRGTLFWDSGIVSGRYESARAFPENNMLILVVRSDEGDGSILALSLSTGERVWGIELGGIEGLDPGRSPASGRYYDVIGDRLFRVDRRERTISVSAHDIGNGDLKWVGYLEGEQEDVVLSTGDDILYATGNSFFGIDPATGAMRWLLNDAWRPVTERSPWLLVRRSDGSRIQLVHRNSGEERWRSPPRIPSEEPLAIGWTTAGVLVGESRGRTTLWGMVDGRRITRETNRYRATSRNDLEYAFPLSKGMLFLQIGSRGSELLRVGERGGTLWAARLESPHRTILSGSGGYAGYDLHIFTGEDVDGDPESVWIVTSLEGVAGLQRVDLGSGTVGEVVPIHQETPILAGDGRERRLFFIDPAGQLVAVGY